jgi:hypothetical protein
VIAEICMLHRSVASVPGLIEFEVIVLLHFLVVKVVAKKRTLPAQAFKRSLTVGESQSWPSIDPTVCRKTTHRSPPKTQNSKWEVLQPQAKLFRSAGTSSNQSSAMQEFGLIRLKRTLFDGVSGEQV